MKAKIFFLLLILNSTLLLVHAQSGWYPLNSGTTTNLRAVFFINQNTGFVAGYSGIILKTTNGGLNWIPQSSGSQTWFTSIYFIDANTGNIVGYDASVRTSNGGNTWIVQNNLHYRYSIYFANSLTGYSAGAGYEVMKTTDGGISWFQKFVSSPNSFYSVFFIDANTGFFGDGNGYVHKTTDGGDSWTESHPGGNGQSLYFTDLNTGYTASGPYIAKTTNSGLNWSSQYYASTYYNSIFFVNSYTGFVVGVNAQQDFISRTTNSGTNWYSSYTGTNALSSIYFPDQNTGYCVGWNGTILKTTNGGITAVEPPVHSVPESYKLYQNYPNPFNPTTKIRFALPKKSFVKIIIYDVPGRTIAELVNQDITPGTYSVDWDASNFSSGIYFYTLLAGEHKETRKMVLIR